MDSRRTRRIINRATTLLVSLVVSLAVCEMVLQAISSDKYYVWRPGLKKEFKPRPGVLPGISGTKQFRINSFGLRGEPFSEDQQYRILAVGGSTTEGLYLDESETWPHLLQAELTASLGRKIWVGNIGRSGHNTRLHMLQVEKLLQQYPKIDAIVLLAGINDFLQRLYNDEDYRPLPPFGSLDAHSYQALVRTAFWVYPSHSHSALPLYKRTELEQRLRQAGFMMVQLVHKQELDGSNFERWRQYRLNATAVRTQLPDLSSALAEYSRNLTTIINLARNSGVRPILATQPTMWQPEMGEESRNSLWMGGVGRFMRSEGHEYYSIPALADGMRMYNAALMKVCRENEVECIDLASALPKDTTVFYDDCHFNESGSRKVAEIIATHFSGPEF